MSIKSSSLYYREAGSDKVYHTQIEEVPGGYVVNFQYGRRGSTLNSGAKTSSPVTLVQAEKVFDKLVKEKMAKGYTPGEDGTPFAGTDKAGEVSGLVPQLLNPITEERVLELLEDEEWLAQEKIDGIHLMTKFSGGSTLGSNRKGLVIPIASTIEQGIKQLFGGGFGVTDGEGIGDIYHVFDLLLLDDEDLRPYGALERWQRLETLAEVADDIDSLRLVRTALYTPGKIALYGQLKAERAEGIVFKKKNAPYVPGRPNSGGNMLKFKFKSSATCWVLGQNSGKRSVSISTRDADGESVVVGNVTIPSNYAVPPAKTLIEVEYLYAYPGGSLFQPVYKGPRPDKELEDLYSSLKFKQGTEEEEA